MLQRAPRGQRAKHRSSDDPAVQGKQSNNSMKRIIVFYTTMHLYALQN